MMFNWKNISLLFALCLAGSGPLQGQPLDSLLALAMRQNPQLRAFELEYEAAGHIGPQWSQLPDPELALGVFVLQPQTRVGPQWFRLGFSQMLPPKGMLQAMEEKGDALAGVEREKIGLRKQMIFRTLTLAWLDLYELEETRRILSQNLELLYGLEELALAKVENGSGKLSDVLLVQLRMEELETKLQSMEYEEANPRAVINQLTGRGLEQEIRLVEDLSFAPLGFRQDSLEVLIEKEHPAIRQLNARQDVSRLDLLINDLDSKPEFGVGLDYLLLTPRPDVELSGNGRDVLMPKASIRIPLNKRKYHHKEEEENLRIQALELEKSETGSQLAVQLEKAYTDWDQSALNYHSYVEQKEKLLAVIRLFESEYSADERRMEELLRLQLDRVDYEIMILTAIVDSHRAMANIESLSNYQN